MACWSEASHTTAAHRQCKLYHIKPLTLVANASFVLYDDRSQLAIATHSMARKPPQSVRTTVAGAAPTATLIKQIEALGITIDHIYGMTETVSLVLALSAPALGAYLPLPCRSSLFYNITSSAP